jgi:alpha-beta hydrolase superfamily lysophospholipase
LIWIKGVTGYTIRAGGHSAGGTILPWYLDDYPNIKSVLAVNPLLNVNPQWTKRGCEEFNGTKITRLIVD